MSPAGTKDDPWQLTTAPGSSTYTMYADPESDPPLLVCQVGSTRLTYLLAAIEDLRAMLAAHGDWMPLGAADEKKEPAERTIEAWGRSPDNPVGGWYGQRKGYRSPEVFRAVSRLRKQIVPEAGHVGIAGRRILRKIKMHAPVFPMASEISSGCDRCGHSVDTFPRVAQCGFRAGQKAGGTTTISGNHRLPAG